jgi:hypothetical protein
LFCFIRIKSSAPYGVPTALRLDYDVSENFIKIQSGLGPLSRFLKEGGETCTFHFTLSLSFDLLSLSYINRKKEIALLRPSFHSLSFLCFNII